MDESKLSYDVLLVCVRIVLSVGYGLTLYCKLMFRINLAFKTWSYLTLLRSIVNRRSSNI